MKHRKYIGYSFNLAGDCAWSDDLMDVTREARAGETYLATMEKPRYFRESPWAKERAECEWYAFLREQLY